MVRLVLTVLPTLLLLVGNLFAAISSISPGNSASVPGTTAISRSYGVFAATRPGMGIDDISNQALPLSKPTGKYSWAISGSSGQHRIRGNAHHRQDAGVLVASATHSVTVSAQPKQTITTGTLAMRANDFLNTLGVDSKLIQGLDSQTQIISALQYTGIRNIRDDATHNAALSPTALCAIHAATGAMVDELPIVDADPNNIIDTTIEYEGLAACGAMLAAEGPNEPNNFHFTYQGNTCDLLHNSSACAAYQRDEYAAIKADPKLANYPVWSMTEVGAEGVNQGLQYLTVPSGTTAIMPAGTIYADFANLHNYVVGTNRLMQDNRAWTTEAPGSAEQCCFDGMDGEFFNQTWAKHFPGNAPDLPRVTTETGWQTSQISQDQQGKLLTNLYLSAAKRGWSYTFIHQLKDENDGDTFGLYTNSFTPKLVAGYIHNLTTIVADTSSSFTPSSLAYSISNAPVTTHDLLLQKANGTYELAVWNDQPTSENPNVAVVVNLPSVVSTINIYDVVSGTNPVSRLTNTNTVPLSLTDHAQIIEFPASGATPIPTPSATVTPTQRATSAAPAVMSGNKLDPR
ncbi:MAG TPA: hypothetical protein VJ728_02615 [Candidatus Binataceae bacterium]|nr:hypothetical protein [Candidatus Binataceae bacterium]